MRLLPYLAVVLATAICDDIIIPATRMSAPGGIPQGAIITIYFRHFNVNNDDHKESVKIYFFDLPSVYRPEEVDVNAYILLELGQAVKTNTFTNGKWVKEEQFSDSCKMPPSDARWRLDIIYLDNYNLAIFLQGCFHGVRTFAKPLNVVRSIYVTSNFIDHDTIKNPFKFPNANRPIATASQFNTADHFYRKKELIAFPSFPIGTHIEMTVMLKPRGSPSFSRSSPLAYIGLRTHTAMPDFLMIFQLFEENKTKLHLSSSNNEKICDTEKWYGELQHVYLQRKSKNVVLLQIFYQNDSVFGTLCEIIIPSHIESELDKPFSLWIHGVADILHIDHSIPAKIE